MPIVYIHCSTAITEDVKTKLAAILPSTVAKALHEPSVPDREGELYATDISVRFTETGKYDVM